MAWLNIKEACEYSHCTRPTFMRWIDQGLRVAKIGNKTYRVKPSYIDEFFEAQYFGGNKEIAKNVIAEMES